MTARLALPLGTAPAGERASQMLPSVACSTCKAQVSLLDLGTHVCSSSPPPASPSAQSSSGAAPVAAVVNEDRPLAAPRPRQPSQQQQASRPLPSPAGHQQLGPARPFADKQQQQQRRPSNQPTTTAAPPPRKQSMSATSNSPLAQSTPPGRAAPVVTKPQPQQQQPQPQQGRRPSVVAQQAANARPLPRPTTDDDRPLEPPPNVFARGPRRSGSTSSVGSAHSATSSSASSPRLGSRQPIPIAGPPSLSHPSASDLPLPSPPLNPWQLRPSSPALSTTSSRSAAGYNPAPSSFHTPTLSYSHERATKTPSPIPLEGVTEQEAWKIMRDAEAGGGAGRAGVGRRAFQLAAAQVMKEQHVVGAFTGLRVETFRPPIMPAATNSPSTYSPHSPSTFSTAVPSPAFALESRSPSSAGSPNAPGSVFSHAASHSTSTSLSSGHQTKPSPDRPSFEAQLDRRLSSAKSDRAAPVQQSDDEASDDGGEGLGENFLNLGDLSDDSDDSDDGLHGRQSRWKRAAGSDSTSSLRSDLLKVVNGGGGGASAKLPFPGNTSRPASPPSSRDTHSWHDHRRQASGTTDSHGSGSAEDAIRFTDRAVPSGKDASKRPPPLATASLMTPSSSMDRLAPEDLRRPLPVPPVSASLSSASSSDSRSLARPASSSEGMEDLESMVDAMRQALVVDASPSSDSPPASSSPISPPPPSAAQHTAPLAPSHAVKRRKACLQCACEVGGRTGKRFVAVKADDSDDGAPSTSKGALCESCWSSLYLPKCRRCTLVIENEAVSSSDGKLQGKYHRHCFSCFSCDRPFDGQTFYVHADRPHCENCYHRQNNTLCQSCTLPIEGPCAIVQSASTHGGELRFHPACLRCDHPACVNSMDEHYDLADGRRLCADHAGKAWAVQQEEARRSAAEDPRGLAVPLLDKPRKRMTLLVSLP